MAERRETTGIISGGKEDRHDPYSKGNCLKVLDTFRLGFFVVLKIENGQNRFSDRIRSQTMRDTRLASNPLGKTGIAVTRLSAGGHFTMGPSCHHDQARRVQELHHLIDRGVTYFDVQWEPEELAMAEVMKTRRSEIAVAWPLHGVTERGANITAGYIPDYCADHRRRFKIEHVEVLLWIALEMRPEDEGILEAMREALRDSKAPVQLHWENIRGQNVWD